MQINEYYHYNKKSHRPQNALWDISFVINLYVQRFIGSFILCVSGTPVRS
jgi:hypothetical protein